MALNNPDPVIVYMGTMTAAHEFRFDYSNAKKLLVGQSISSPVCTLAGRSYRILFYPQGLVENPNSMCLKWVVSSATTDTISFGYIFLNKYGKPTSKASERTTFRVSPPHDSFGITSMIEMSEIEAEFVKGGCFTLMFSLTFSGESYKEVPKQVANGIISYSINEHFAELLENKVMADVTFGKIVKHQT